MNEMTEVRQEIVSQIDQQGEGKRQKSISKIKKLVDDINQEPTESAMKVFKLMLPILHKGYDSLAVYNEKRLIEAISGDESYKLVMEYKVDAMKVGLGFNEASVMERLLIEQVALSWLRLQTAESRLTSAKTERMIKFYDERTSAAQRRFLRSAESLAKVRKLMTQTPALQINIAHQQVNQVNV